MNTFKSFFFFELKRRWTWQTLAAFLLILLLSFYFTYLGILNYADIIKNKKDFKDTESLKVQSFNNYMQYGGYGFRLLFIPSSTNVFFYNTGLFLELVAQIDVGERLDIYEPVKGNKIFAEKPGKLMDFSGIILIFGSLIALFYGYDSFRHQEYSKFLTTFCGYRRVFLFTWLSRMIILNLFFFIIAAISITFALYLLKINDFSFSSQTFSYLSVFLLMMFLMLLFFFSIGTFAAILKFKFKPLLMISAIVFTWIASIYFIPVGINKYVESKTSSIISNYRTEFDKLKMVLDFERWAASEQKERKVSQEELKAAYNNSIKDVLHLENERNVDILPNIKRLQNLSMWYPSTFYITVNREISSSGYQGIRRFFHYALKIKERFIFDFYTDRRNQEREKSRKERAKQQATKKNQNKMNTDDKGEQEVENKAQGESKEQPEVESFIKDDENLFVAKSQLPNYFWMGLILTVIYIAIFSFISFFFFQKSVFSVSREKNGKEKNDGFAEFKIELQDGRCEVVLSRGELLKDHFYNVFSGRNKKFNGKILKDGQEIAANAQQYDFLYICQPEEIPGDIKVRDLVLFMGSLMKTPRKQLKGILENFEPSDSKKIFSDLEEEDKARILLAAALLKKSDTYIFYEFVKGMPADYLRRFRQRLQQLKDEKACILYFTNDVLQGRKVGDYVSLLKEDADLMSIDA
jgi:ABC-type Na+ transport system ATPase subunit NatA